MTDSTFHVRINEGPEQVITVKTGLYQYAAVAACAILGVTQDGPEPVHVEIWCPSLLPQYGPYHYLIKDDEYGRIVVHHAVADTKRKLAA